MSSSNQPSKFIYVGNVVDRVYQCADSTETYNRSQYLGPSTLSMPIINETFRMRYVFFLLYIVACSMAIINFRTLNSKYIWCESDRKMHNDGCVCASVFISEMDTPFFFVQLPHRGIST